MILQVAYVLFVGKETVQPSGYLYGPTKIRPPSEAFFGHLLPFRGSFKGGPFFLLMMQVPPFLAWKKVPELAQTNPIGRPLLQN